MPNKETIQLAIKDLRAEKVKNYTATARKHSINKETLHWYYNGLQLMQDEAAFQHKKKLSNQQEQMLLLHIEEFAAHSFAPTPQIIQNLIVEIIKEPVEIHWVRCFTECYKPQIQRIHVHGIDQKHKIADNSTHFEHYFQLLNEKIKKYNIEPSNIYNFDEKGFLIDIDQATKQIIPVEAMKAK
ncbi:uncharacterized protein PADG_11441 [Paracoccidioides brasiliensis Pb18]|uniref:HTH psq-type domain-containing protein n=1 Tax=Paracoccidioides brasiliensis (strain Pb18) TaxID=502780 RepID=A0A0A0HUK0_PARBD|nr:uncharacterized protein PADG_11441 [Paracoccidioides brasiliensis Pb18]KGM92257.1 hypothetical protein PADG_11441 [Paracoccidioides brasiliensis Pb18]